MIWIANVQHTMEAKTSYSSWDVIEDGRIICSCPTKSDANRIKYLIQGIKEEETQ